jgi:hypothetical protein
MRTRAEAVGFIKWSAPKRSEGVVPFLSPDARSESLTVEHPVPRYDINRASHS